MVKIFETRIVSVGEQALNMIEEANMLILFGMEAPADLADYCYKISNKDLLGSINRSTDLIIDGKEYPVTAVGSVVEQNLSTLGHITIVFDGSREGSLPGALHVEAGTLPILKEGVVISMQNKDM